MERWGSWSGQQFFFSFFNILSDPDVVKQILSMLLEGGADANLADCLGATPLHRAASCGHLKVLRILVEHGANVQKTDAQGNSPL